MEWMRWAGVRTWGGRPSGWTLSNLQIAGTFGRRERRKALRRTESPGRFRSEGSGGRSPDLACSAAATSPLRRAVFALRSKILPAMVRGGVVAWLGRVCYISAALRNGPPPRTSALICMPCTVPIRGSALAAAPASQFEARPLCRVRGFRPRGRSGGARGEVARCRVDQRRHGSGLAARSLNLVSRG